MSRQHQATEQGDSENAQHADDKHESPTGMPMLGDRIMVTNEAWLAVILSGTKSMEVRRAPVQTGPTWIGHEGQIYASANITECRELSEEDYEKSRAQHLHLSRMKTGDRLYGLLLTDIVQLIPPVEYYRRPTRSIWEVFKTGPDDKLPRGKAAKRHLHMPALQDHETGVENKDNSTHTNTAEEEEDDNDDDQDDINDEKGGRPQRGEDAKARPNASHKRPKGKRRRSAIPALPVSLISPSMPSPDADMKPTETRK